MNTIILNNGRHISFVHAMKYYIKPKKCCKKLQLTPQEFEELIDKLLSMLKLQQGENSHIINIQQDNSPVNREQSHIQVKEQYVRQQQAKEQYAHQQQAKEQYAHQQQANEQYAHQQQAKEQYAHQQQHDQPQHGQSHQSVQQPYSNIPTSYTDNTVSEFNYMNPYNKQILPASYSPMVNESRNPNQSLLERRFFGSGTVSQPIEHNRPIEHSRPREAVGSMMEPSIYKNSEICSRTFDPLLRQDIPPINMNRQSYGCRKNKMY